MKCPFCGNPDSKVIDSRPDKGGTAIRRRRECELCSRRFTTFEMIEETPLIVIKKDGRKEKFDRNKLMRGVLTACSKRSIPLDKIEKLINGVEVTLRKRSAIEIPSQLIGELVMRKLKSLDKIAYIRFASVYQDFDTITAFEQEVRHLRSVRGAL